MDKKTQKQLIEMCEQWLKHAQKKHAWCKANRENCGWSDSSGQGLGDEGWHKLLRYTAEADVFVCCAQEVLDAVNGKS